VQDGDATPSSQATICTSASARQEGIKKKKKLRVVISKLAVAWQLVLVSEVSEDFPPSGNGVECRQDSQRAIDARRVKQATRSRWPRHGDAEQHTQHDLALPSRSIV
jgi:hypothetical protein